MPFDILECCSVASGPHNEDRAGAAGPFAWIFDGATDVVERRLTDGPSDAAWFAETLHQSMHSLATSFTGPMAELPPLLATITRDALQTVAVRLPADRSEHPSAAGIIVRETGDAIEYVALGDCTMMVRSPQRLHVIGVDEMRTGDLWVQEEIRMLQAGRPDTDMAATRSSLWPRLRQKRAAMNIDNGYAIFSITPPPAHRVIAGRVGFGVGDPILLATDGLTRLIDVFASHDEVTFFEAAMTRGLASLADDVRARETADAACRDYPRAKTSDDATGLLLSYRA